MDDARRELLSRGRGGFVRSWEHRIGIEPEGPHRCRYTDEVGIEAGIFAAAVWAFARLFYRQGRLRRFIHNLPVSNSRGCWGPALHSARRLISGRPILGPV